MINQNSSQASLKETTISRQTRLAFLTTLVFALASLLNFFFSLNVSLTTHSWVSYIDTAAIAIFFGIVIHSAILIRQGEKDRGIWRLIIALIAVLGIRNFVNAGMGNVFALLVAVLIPFVALLTLKQQLFSRALGLGVAAASAYLIFDILLNRYFPDMRQTGETIDFMARMIGVIAALLTFSYLYLFFQQSRYILLSSKIGLGMILVVLFPLIVLGVASNLSLSNSLIPRQEQTMISRSSYLAENINAFLRTTKSALAAEAQSTAVRDFLLAGEGMAQGNIIRGIRSNVTLENLLSFKRKDILYIESYAILDVFGENLLDTTSENIGQNEAGEEYFSAPLESGLPYVSDVYRSNTPNQYIIVFSAPVKSSEGVTIGILRAQYKAQILDQFFEIYSALTIEEPDAETFAALLYQIPTVIIDENDPETVYLLLANTSDSSWNFKIGNHLTTNVITPLQINKVLPPGSTAQLSLNLLGLEDGLANRTETPVFEGQAFPRDNDSQTAQDLIATAPIAEKPDWIVLTSQNLQSVNKPIQQQRETITFITILIAIGATILAYFGSRYLIRPILRLTKIADKVAQGDFSNRAQIDTEDEIGTLGRAFNTMTEQLDNLVSTLEERVNSRIADIERNTEKLQAAAEVGKVAVSLRNLDNILTQATELISLRFGFYHTGIFLLDEKSEYAVLRAASSEGGKRMLEKNHKLKIGEVGIVGYVTKMGQARIALDVGQDAVYFDNPDLPQTRSEMALALIAGGRILGALDIQSTQGEAFSDADIATLQVLADQIAISIENARLFKENRDSLQALRRAYGEQSHVGWQEVMHKRKHYGYQGKRDGSVIPILQPSDPKALQQLSQNKVLLDETESTANIPIMVRGNPIGMLRLSKPETAHSWTENELLLAQTLSTELSGALDSARLFDETRQQAEKEYVVGEITDKMRESMNVESIVKMAADEIYKLLDLDQIAIHFTPADEEDGNEDAA